MPADVLVLGGGPAGCAAARLLAQWGHDVVLVTKPATSSFSLAESLPPSTGKLFDLLGVREAIDQAGFVRSSGNTVCWGGGELRMEPFAAGARGWQVTATRLEPILQTAAADAGVHIEHARVGVDESLTGAAAYTLDCSGRAGVLARARGLRQYESGQRTVALVGLWGAHTSFALPEPTHTLIESYINGWAWSVPDESGRRYVAVMVDPRTSDLAHDRTARDVYGAEIRKTTFLRDLLDDAVLLSGPHGWDASTYSATRYADDNLLLVGDAGSFIDPLSSAGVKKALASGWLAAVTVHTALVRPPMRHIAFDFFSARETDVYASFRRLTERFLTDGAAGHLHPFWNDRTADLDATSHADAEATAVKAAFESIRHSQSLRLRRGADVRVEQHAGVSGCEIVLEPRLVSETHPAGVRYAFDVDLIALVDLAPGYDQPPDLFAAYNQRCAPVALPDFLAALATAVAKGFLEGGT